MKMNAPRYTCRAWMGTSNPDLRYSSSHSTNHACSTVQVLIPRSKTETRLLTHMLKPGNWWAAAMADKATLEQERFQNTRYIHALSPLALPAVALTLEYMAS